MNIFDDGGLIDAMMNGSIADTSVFSKLFLV